MLSTQEAINVKSCKRRTGDKGKNFLVANKKKKENQNQSKRKSLSPLYPRKPQQEAPVTLIFSVNLESLLTHYSVHSTLGEVSDCTISFCLPLRLAARLRLQLEWCS